MLMKKIKRSQDDADVFPKKRQKENQIKNVTKTLVLEEIFKLREIESKSHSSLFHMQIEELFQETKIKSNLLRVTSEWLNEFNSFLNSLQSQTEKCSSENLTWMNETQFKASFMRKNTKKQKFQFQFLKPLKSSFFVGSMLTETFVDHKLKIDVCLEIPSTTFQKGDFLNMIYEEKRSLYLLYLADQMVKSKKYDPELLYYNYYENNRLKSVLEVKMSGKFANKIVFRIFLVPEENSFKLNRFVPWNSNIRSTLFEECVSEEDDILYATPNYNANVLFDLTMKKNSQMIYAALKKYNNLHKGLVLLKIWLKQRCLGEGSCGFNSHIITLFVIWLFEHGKLNDCMSSYQVAKIFWSQIALSSWNEEGKGISMCSLNNYEISCPKLEQMHQYFDVVFVDYSGFLNICANVSLENYLRIKNECRRAIELLNSNNTKNFEKLFMTKQPYYVQFDYIFGFKREDIRQILDNRSNRADKYNFAGYWLPHAIKVITRILRKGLGERVINLTPIEKRSLPWPLDKEPNKINKYLIIGVILNPERAFEILDKGPQANQEASVEFRDFWGEKSELRRFKDGSITEACVWAQPSDSLREKRLIVKKITVYLLKRHFQINNVRYFANHFDYLFALSESGRSYTKLYDSEQLTVDVIKNFDDIGKKLRALQDLPLDVTGIQGISPVFRYCQPAPILNKGRAFVQSQESKLLFQGNGINEGIIELGISGKWPNELQAFRMLKAAFHIQIANFLKKAYKIEARSGTDGIHILNNGYIYKIEISHPKEIALSKKICNIQNVVNHIDTIESINLEKRFVILPKITSALHGLYQQFSSFGPTVMISKNWINSQLIDSYHWPNECTELLIASQYLNIDTLMNPCQPQTGFFRFLHLLAHTNWIAEMIVLNFHNNLSSKDIIKLQNEFSNNRHAFPPMFIATSFDEQKYGLWWTKESPSSHILARITLLAKRAILALESEMYFENNIVSNNLFIPSLDGYDAIIWLKKEVIKMNSSIPLAGFNPLTSCMNELREGYSDFALFFFNPYGGNEIAVKWKPSIFKQIDFNISSIKACYPYKQKLTRKMKTLIADFKIILKGIYDRIEIF